MGHGMGYSRGGLSPYTRGNRFLSLWALGPWGSIPVHTGEPFRVKVGCKGIGVYPRTHGGTRLWAVGPWGFLGLSPYTRGNRRTQFLQLSQEGSIPVHTGEPR